MAHKTIALTTELRELLLAQGQDAVHWHAQPLQIMGGVPEACWSGGTGQAWESWPPSEALAFRWGAQPCPGHRSKQESRSDLPGGFASSLSSPVVGGQGGVLAPADWQHTSRKIVNHLLPAGIEPATYGS